MVKLSVRKMLIGAIIQLIVQLRAQVCSVEVMCIILLLFATISDTEWMLLILGGIKWNGEEQQQFNDLCPVISRSCPWIRKAPETEEE